MGIFPNEAFAIRLVGAILADRHDELQATDRRYLSEDSMSQLYPSASLATAELTAGHHHRGSTQKPPLDGTPPSSP